MYITIATLAERDANDPSGFALATVSGRQADTASLFPKCEILFQGLLISFRIGLAKVVVDDQGRQCEVLRSCLDCGYTGKQAVSEGISDDTNSKFVDHALLFEQVDDGANFVAML